MASIVDTNYFTHCNTSKQARTIVCIPPCAVKAPASVCRPQVADRTALSVNGHHVYLVQWSYYARRKPKVFANNFQLSCEDKLVKKIWLVFIYSIQSICQHSNLKSCHICERSIDLYMSSFEDTAQYCTKNCNMNSALYAVCLHTYHSKEGGAAWGRGVIKGRGWVGEGKEKADKSCLNNRTIGSHL